MSTGVSETVTSEELKENRLFIDSVMETDVMKVRRLSNTRRTDPTLPLFTLQAVIKQIYHFSGVLQL